jgi:hypothetical protein
MALLYDIESQWRRWSTPSDLSAAKQGLGLVFFSEMMRKEL